MAITKKQIDLINDINAFTGHDRKLMQEVIDSVEGGTGGEPVDAYTKQEADDKFATKDFGIFRLPGVNDNLKKIGVKTLVIKNVPNGYDIGLISTNSSNTNMYIALANDETFNSNRFSYVPTSNGFNITMLNKKSFYYKTNVPVEENMVIDSWDLESSTNYYTNHSFSNSYNLIANSMQLRDVNEPSKIIYDINKPMNTDSTMPNDIKQIRGSQIDVVNYVGEEGQIVVDTTNKSIRVMDGKTFGGNELASKSDLGGLKLVKITQSEYDALSSKDENTLYVIVG